MQGAALFTILNGMRWLSSDNIVFGAVGTSRRISARALMMRSCTAACCAGGCHVSPGTGASSSGFGGIKQNTRRRKQKDTMLPFATRSLTTNSRTPFSTSCRVPNASFRSGVQVLQYKRQQQVQHKLTSPHTHSEIASSSATSIPCCS